MLLSDDDRRYVDANPAACRLLGLPSELIVGKTIDDFTPPEMRHRVDEMWRAFREQGTQSGEYELMQPDGGRLRCQYSATADIEPGCHLSILMTVPPAEREEGDDESQQAHEKGQPLSPRERQVMALIADGETGVEISERLRISPETVRNHVRAARAKLGARTRAHAIALAVQRRELDL
jgi:HTH-type transcriptional regulator, bacterioopsin transcriptional activator and related proteins